MEISYTKNYVEYVAVVLNTGRYTKWGNQIYGDIATWYYSNQYELIGLYGTILEGISIGSIGTIVY